MPQSIENNKIVDKFIDYDLTFKSLFKLLLNLKSKNFDKIYYLQEKSNFTQWNDYQYCLCWCQNNETKKNFNRNYIKN